MVQQAQVNDVDINVFTRHEGITNPFPYYDIFRPLSPVPGYVDWSPGTVPGIDPPYTAWAVFSYDQVLAIMKNHEVFSNVDPIQEASAAPTIMLEGHDEPEHGRLRRLVSQAFTPRRIAGLGPWLGEQMTQALDELGDGSFDACETLTHVLPTRAMGRLLGLPGVSFDQLLDWSHAFMQSADLTPEERQARCIDMIQVITQTVIERAEALRGRDRNLEVEEAGDLITALLLAREEGEGGPGADALSVEDIVLFVTTLIVAGNETQVSLGGHALNVLGSMPHVQAALRADRDRTNNFIDETMRMYGPGQRLFRGVLADTEVGGQRIEKDEWVAIFFGAANRDPKVFPDPHTFDMDRPNVRQHLGFGHGLHYCLGAHLGRLNVATLVNAVLDRYSTIEGAGDPQPGAVSVFTYGFWHLPLELRH